MSTSKKLEAHTQNRTYYFYLVNKAEDSISITMYSTPYTLVLKNGKWENHTNNNLNMAPHLIDAVVAVVVQ